MGSEISVLILGRGAMGQVFQGLLEDRCRLHSWDRDPETGAETEPLESAAAGWQLVILAVPTAPHDELAARLADVLEPGAACVSIAKGLDGEGRTPARILERRLGRDHAWGLLYGPMIAREMHEGRAGFAMAASEDAALRERLLDLFHGTPLHLAASEDVHGVAWAAILKNVYVPLVGAAEALELGDNMRGFLLTAILDELARIVAAMGGEAATAYGLAGLGDLVTTATSPASHHRRIGEELVRGETEALAATGANIRSEGVHTAHQVMAHRLFDPEAYPLFRLVLAFLERPQAFDALLQDYLHEVFAR